MSLDINKLQLGPPDLPVTQNLGELVRAIGALGEAVAFSYWGINPEWQWKAYLDDSDDDKPFTQSIGATPEEAATRILWHLEGTKS